MIVDGIAVARHVADEVREAVERKKLALTLGIVSMSDSPVTTKYLMRKKKFAESVGITCREVVVPQEGTQKDVEGAVRGLVADDSVSGILVQLPLPAHVNTEAVLSLIPPARDPDVLSKVAREKSRLGEGVLPPVVGAMREMLLRNNVSLSGKNVAVVGEGNLVGKPAATWAAAAGAMVTVIGERTEHPEKVLKQADIIISGAGSPGLIKPDMIKEGVIILDAGTTDVSGSLKGDADPACAEKCSLFTPVPGGIGPLTIAMVYKNLITLSQKS